MKFLRFLFWVFRNEPVIITSTFIEILGLFSIGIIVSMFLPVTIFLWFVGILVGGMISVLLVYLVIYLRKAYIKWEDLLFDILRGK